MQLFERRTLRIEPFPWSHCAQQQARRELRVRSTACRLRTYRPDKVMEPSKRCACRQGKSRTQPMDAHWRATHSRTGTKGNVRGQAPECEAELSRYCRLDPGSFASLNLLRLPPGRCAPAASLSSAAPSRPLCSWSPNSAPSPGREGLVVALTRPSES